MSDSTLKAFRATLVDFKGLAHSSDQIAKQFRYIAEGLLVIEDGKIRDLMPWSAQAEQQLGCEVIDLRGKIIMPGLIDTHIHYPQTEMIAAFGEQLLEWLEHYTFPTESKYGDAAYAAEMAAFLFVSCLAMVPLQRWCSALYIRNPSMRCSAKQRNTPCA